MAKEVMTAVKEDIAIAIIASEIIFFMGYFFLKVLDKRRTAIVPKKINSSCAILNVKFSFSLICMFDSLEKISSPASLKKVTCVLYMPGSNIWPDFAVNCFSVNASIFSKSLSSKVTVVHSDSSSKESFIFSSIFAGLASSFPLFSSRYVTHNFCFSLQG